MPLKDFLKPSPGATRLKKRNRPARESTAPTKSNRSSRGPDTKVRRIFNRLRPSSFPHSDIQPPPPLSQPQNSNLDLTTSARGYQALFPPHPALNPVSATPRDPVPTPSSGTWRQLPSSSRWYYYIPPPPYPRSSALSRSSSTYSCPPTTHDAWVAPQQNSTPDHDQVRRSASEGDVTVQVRRCESMPPDRNDGEEGKGEVPRRKSEPEALSTG
ncbi:MAG: hypothetical protein M1822_003586 [Bathelium mastoideum]|nr:MAG: hypothetical protein M1822_003586 [Bathelium mastoideum]